MKRYFQLSAIFFVLFFQLIAMVAFATEQKSDLRSIVSQFAYYPKMPTKVYDKPSQFITKHKFDKLKLSHDQKVKIERLYNLLKHQMGAVGLRRYDILRIVKFIEFVRTARPAWIRASHSLYIHKEAGFLKIPVQFYRNGKVFILLKSHDPLRVRGGFKGFSRSIDYDSEQIFAHLVMHVENAADVNMIVRELQAMHALRHSAAVLNFKAAGLYWGFHKRSAVPKVSYETELFDKDLGTYNCTARPISWQQIIELARQAAFALQEVHRHGFVHRDVKLENFLVKEFDDHKPPKLVIADLGTVDYVEDCEQTFVGTKGFIAPELCLFRIHGQRAPLGEEARVKADVYALGMVFLNLFKGEPSRLQEATVKLNSLALKDRISASAAPNGALNEVYKHYKRYVDFFAQKGAPASIPESFFHLTVSMLNVDAAQRISLEEVLHRLDEMSLYI